MENIYKSASKIVFIIMALGVSAGLFLGKIEPKDYLMLASMCFTFYFSNKGDSSQEYAGK
jgi:hypothetical protein